MPHFEQNTFTVLLVQIAAIMVASRSLGQFTRWLGQPLVIAEVLAGILLGPSFLGWIWPQGMGFLFPPGSLSLLRMLSQVGLVLFMFLVGLEIDPGLLRGRAHSSIAISHTGIVVPFILGAAASGWVHDRYAAPGVPFLSLMLFMGVAMSITAFPVLARILSERHLLGTRLGAIAIACAAVDDVTAWCLLAFVVAVARAQALAQALWTTGFAAAYVLAIFWGVRPFLRRVGQRVADRQGLTPAMVVGALLWLLASAWITETIGIHALFGAFLAGAALPKEGGLASALAERLEAVAVTLLLPLFFAYSGLRTEIGLLAGPADWAAALAIIALATLGKFGGGTAAARLTGLGWREASAIGILMNTRGLMELIVLNIGLDLGVISPALFAILVVMALVTTFATTPVLGWIYPVRELIRDRAPAPAVARADLAAPYTLLMCVSDSRTGPAMAALAGSLSARAPDGERLYALHLAPPSDRPSSELRPSPGPVEAAPLAPLLARAQALGLEVRPLTFVSSDPGGDISRTAEVVRADLVLLGWHRPLLVEGRLGGTVRDVMNATPAPVAVLVDRGLTRVRRVLVAFAGSPEDRASLGIARRIAADPAAEVTLLHVVAPGRAGGTGPGRRQIEDALQEQTTPFRNIRLKVVEHPSAEQAALEEAARGYDLVVAAIAPDHGLRWRGLAFRRQRLLSECPASLLAVRPEPQSQQA